MIFLQHENKAKVPVPYSLGKKVDKKGVLPYPLNLG
jgi:hypothetical protein